MNGPERITSTRNARVKALVRLRERRTRDREGAFPVEGAREVARALEGGAELREAYLCPELFRAEGAEVAARLERRGVPTTHLSPEAFGKASLRGGPDGVLAVASTWRLDPETLELPPRPLLLVVDGLEKPGNLGALLRTADAAEVDAVFATGAGTDLFNPNVVRASVGSLFARPVLTLGAGELLRWLERRGVAVVATSPHATRVFWDAPLAGPEVPTGVAIVLGPEHEGLEARWLDAAALRVRVPMGGLADSLNVATTGALLLYEALRQRRAAGAPAAAAVPGASR